MSDQSNNQLHNQMTNSSQQNHRLNKSPSVMISHSNSSLQLSNKLSPIMSTKYSSLSKQLMNKSHSISSPYIKKRMPSNQSNSDNKNNKNNHSSKYLRSPSPLLALINKRKFHQQNPLQNQSINSHNDKELTLKHLRKQVYRFFNYRREEMNSKQRSFNYLLPRISVKQDKQLVNSNQSPQPIGQQKKTHSQSSLSPEIFAYRKRYQQELSKITFQLPKHMQKKQRFFDISEQTMNEINDSSSSIKQLEGLDQQMQKKLHNNGLEKNNQQQIGQNIKSQSKDEKRTTKFSLINHAANKHINQLVEEPADPAVPEFLMERLQLVGSYKKLKKSSFLTQFYPQQ